jgi:hypothetical protein
MNIFAIATVVLVIIGSLAVIIWRIADRLEAEEQERRERRQLAIQKERQVAQFEPPSWATHGNVVVQKQLFRDGSTNYSVTATFSWDDRRTEQETRRFNVPPP